MLRGPCWQTALVHGARFAAGTASQKPAWNAERRLPDTARRCRAGMAARLAGTTPTK